MPLSATTRRQLHRITDIDGMLVLLMLTHTSFGTVRVVNDTRDWSISGNTWIGLPFRFTLPNAAQGESPRARLEIDNVGRELMSELEALPPGAALQATIRVVSRATPTVVDFEFTAQMTGVSATTSLVQAVVGNDDALRSPVVKMRYDPTIAPALFEG